MQIQIYLLTSVLGLFHSEIKTNDPNTFVLDEKTICFLEEHIPELVEAAIQQAYWQALASGSSVLVSKDGALVEISPDGTERIIKELPPSTPVVPNQILKIQ